jgi:predicted transcriptional regulator
MSQRHNIVLPDDISKVLEQLSVERDTTKGEVMATALKLYAAAFAGRKRGLAVGLADPQTRQLQTEFIGL